MATDSNPPEIPDNPETSQAEEQLPENQAPPDKPPPGVDPNNPPPNLPPPPGTKPLGPEDWIDNPELLDPQNEEQALFYLGWMAGDVPPAVRHQARQEYMSKYGPLSSSAWNKWKQKMGYGETA